MNWDIETKGWEDIFCMNWDIETKGWGDFLALIEI